MIICYRERKAKDNTLGPGRRSPPGASAFLCMKGGGRVARDKKMTLTEKQKRFIDEYLIDMNASAAAKRAGYSERNAGKIGHQLLEKNRIAQALADRLRARMKRTEVTQDFVLENLKAIVERAMQHEDSQFMQAANKALDLLGKHLGMYTDKVDVKGELTVSGLLKELGRR